MASKKKKTYQKRPKNKWFVACFGIIHPKPASETKPNEPGDPKRLFKLCMPKIKAIIIRRKKKYSFDANKVALKTTQNMTMLEATKVQQLKIEHASITQEPNVQLRGGDDRHNLETPEHDESNTTTSRKQEPALTTVDKCHHDKVTKDSLTGMSIIIIMLIIMSIWGRLCAILCMSAWLYCIPILRMYKEATTNLANIKIDISSKLYKKKVALLQRDNNN